jgi:hypothetical protein
LYKNGNKEKEQGIMIIETGKEHSPFSFFKLIFIKSRQNYNASQWTLLFDHEKEHANQLHSLDNLLLIILRIICWFHPLAHIFYHRLRMVHEFQADQAAAKNTYQYGTFLLEQNLIQGAPVLAHSFHYSPLKTRIAMLTKTGSSRSKLLKYLTVFPLLMLFIIFCSQNSFSGQFNQQKQKKKVIFRGNQIEFAELKVIPFAYMETFKKQKKIFVNVTLPDSVPISDWLTGEIKMEKVLLDLMPVAINGKPIFGKEPQYIHPEYNRNYSEPVCLGSSKLIDPYLFSMIKNELDQLDHGTYIFNINSLVIDDQGKVAYYENAGISSYMGSSEKKPMNSQKLLKGITQKLTDVLNGPIKFKPALRDGKPINVRMNMGYYMIEVKNHKAVLLERTGC